jgi:hypothetical protein
LLRLRLFKLGEAEHVLVLSTHHIVADGWSVGVLFKELGTLRKAYSRGEASPLPEPKIQYADYAVWQRKWLQGEVLETELSYWRQQLADIPELTFSTARVETAAGFKSITQPVEFSQSLSDRLRDLSKRESATLYITMLAAFKTLLYRFTGQEDVVVGAPIANRNRAETEGLIGYFVNTLVLRTDLSGNLSFRELINRVRATALAAYAHQDLPFEKLVDELKPKRIPGRNPLYQIVFDFHNLPYARSRASSSHSNPTIGDEGNLKFDLTFCLADTGRELSGNLEYSRGLLEPSTVNRLLDNFKVLLEEVTANPDLRLLEIPLLETRNASPNSDTPSEINDRSEQFNF